MHRFFCLVWLGLLLPLATGCDQIQALVAPAAEDELDLDLAELDEPSDSDDDASTREASAADGDDTPQALTFRLEVGDRFPLSKTIDQQLTQVSDGGVVTSHSRLEMLMAIRVEENASDGRTRLGVQYSQVRYAHELPGETVEFDSSHPSGDLPLSVQAYAGLAGNGFSFWMTPDHRIDELVDFQSFLERCVKHVSSDRRQDVINHLAATTGEEGIANFIDDSIGLLPTEIDLGGERRAPRIGDTWTRQRQVARPVPMHLSNRYVLKNINDEVAEIDIIGSAAPLMTYGGGEPQTAQSEMKLTLRGGYAMGSCVIDRQTGLPKDSRVEQYLEMLVELEGGKSFEQRKQTVTTIRAYPEQQSSGSASGVVPASGQQSASPGQDAYRSDVVPAGGDFRQRQ